jgi:HAD superfamily hydrolase (TIGR01509 family)
MIIDLDGVVTKTAAVHFQAWKETFEELLPELPDSSGPDEFSHEEDYLPYVDGRPRYQGVKLFLESRDVVLPFGTPADDPGHDTICAVGNKKRRRFREMLESDGAQVFEPAVELVRREKGQGCKVAIISSSEDCGFVLRQVGLEDLFDTRVDGQVAAALRLDGKPAPDTFLVAADNLGVAPARTVVIEDAEAGVEAGRRGNFGLVVGVDRYGNREALMSRGADLVVPDLRALTEETLSRWFEEERREELWSLDYYGYEPQEERLREALTTVGNGYMGTRGALPWEVIADDVHYPGTYFMGLFNKVPTEVHGRTIYNNDFVNCPNWSSVKVALEDGEYLQIDETDVLEYRHWLDIKRGLCHHEIRVQDEAGRITRFTSHRLISMERMHLGAVQCSVTPENYSGRLRVLSAIDGGVINYGVERYRELTAEHLEPVSEEDRGDGVALTVRTSASKIDVVMEARTKLHSPALSEAPKRRVIKEPRYVAEEFSFDAAEGQEYQLFKAVGFATSRDMDHDDAQATARETAESAGSFEEIRDAHEQAWSKLWKRADIDIEGDRFSQNTIRLHIFHLLTTASPHNTKIDAGMTARGLHGEAYRGHFFWDELFTLPFYNLHFPDVTRSFLCYRYRRLDAAREYARSEGYEGAMYPWQSADTGEEESQVIHYNPRSGEWDPDLSRNQRHISLAVAYNIWTYFYASDDAEFLHKYGMEMLLEICRFWVSKAHYEEENGRYHISGVMGPNEFHEKYPGAEEGGYRDNAYTNIVTAWLLHKTIETYDHLPNDVKAQLQEKISFKEEELSTWREVAEGLAVVIRDDGIISQFDGWMELRELDWERYREKYDNIRRMDRILKAENDSPNRYKVSKQADMLMTFYLMAPGQVKQMLQRMGYEVGDETELIRKNYEYYVRRTSHGSTLSYVVHSAIARYIPGYRRQAWKWFMEAMRSDRYDTQGGTTPEGIHCGVMAGTVAIILENFAGINLFADHLSLEPELPREWSSLAFKIEQRGRIFDIRIAKHEVTVERLEKHDPDAPPLSIVVHGTEHSLDGEKLSVKY